MLSLAIRVSCLAALCAVLMAGPAMSYPKDAGPKGSVDLLKDRARWEWKCGGKSGTFQGHVDGKVTHGKKMGDKWHVIGSWNSPAPHKIHVTLKEGPLEGKAELTRTPAALPTYEGTLVRTGGKKDKKKKEKEERLIVELYKD